MIRCRERLGVERGRVAVDDEHHHLEDALGLGERRRELRQFEELVPEHSATNAAEFARVQDTRRGAALAAWLLGAPSGSSVPRLSIVFNALCAAGLAETRGLAIPDRIDDGPERGAAG